MTILDQQRRSPASFGWSLLLHAVFLLLLAAFGHRLTVEPAKHSTGVIVFTPSRPPPQERAVAAYKPKALYIPQPRPILAPISKPVILEAPPVRPPERATLPAATPRIEVPRPPEPARAPATRTGLFETQKAPAVETRMNTAPAAVTGAFAVQAKSRTDQPNPLRTETGTFEKSGMAGTPTSNTTRLRVAEGAGFSGASNQSGPVSPSRPVASQSGFGDPRAVAKNIRKAAPALNGGFGSAVMAANNSRPAPVEAQNNFGDVSAASTAAPAHRTEVRQIPAATPVEITFKPRPEYTADARRLQLEGEVVLEVTFTASGEVHMLRILRGLGHGLDENAVAAARAIRFRPAERAGKPVDVTGTVRIRFELAY